jgi:hypothetical protein
MKGYGAHDARRVLNQAEWGIVNGEVGTLSMVQLDVFRFRFPDGMDRDAAEALISYMKAIRMDELRAVMKLWVWLVQHDVRFRLTSAWNGMAPVLHNLGGIFRAAYVRRRLGGYGHDGLMAVDLLALEGGKDGKLE